MKSVGYQATELLSCADAGGSVVIALTDTTLTADGTGYVYGTLVNANQYNSNTGSPYFVYGIIYDEGQLTDPNTGITCSNIKCVFCKDCKAEWLQSLIPVEEEPPMYETFTSIDITSTPEVIKASAGSVRGYYIHNNATSVRYVKLWNSATAPDPATTALVPVILAIPKGQAANVSQPDGVEFDAGIFISATQLQAIDDVTDPAAGDLTINIFYT